jgi:hypothetical protein
LPLLFSFGAVDDAPALGVLEDELEGVALDADELVSDEAGGVLELDDEALLDGGVDGAIEEVDDELLGDVDEGGVAEDDDEVDGDGVTVGGDVVEVVDDSRLQPAMPSTSPVQSTVINALFIEISICCRDVPRRI